MASYSTALGGAERLLVEFASGLGGECSLACPPGPLAEVAERAGLRVFLMRGRRLRLRGSPLLAMRDLTGYRRELRRLVRDLRPEAIVAWSMRPLLACSPAQVHVPVVFQHNDFLPGPVVGTLVRRAAARSALVVACSHAVARELDPRGRLGGRLRVIHPGVEVGESVNAQGTSYPSSSGPVIVMVGALAPWKRPDFALEAFLQLRSRRPDAVLRFVGAAAEGAEEFAARLRDRGRAVGAVEFAGQVGDVRGELGRATCLLHCAEREPFGRVVLEALAAGRPAVVPDGASGVAEIIDAACALSYPAGKARAAAEMLERVLADPEFAARMGDAGRARACRNFDLDLARREWAASVRSVTERHGALPAHHDRGSRVTIVTVTHNSAARLAGLLGSVDRHLPGARVLVVDCASGDESLAVAQGHPGTVAVPLSENVGFGPGCNRGVAAVESPVTMLLNPDIELLDDSVLELAEEAVRRDRPERLLAPLVLSPDGSRQDTVHPAPVSPADLVRSLVSPTVLPARPLAPWRATSPTRVGWAVGCAVVARTETLRRLGPFDERLFLYGEDLDLGLRAVAAGVTTWFWPLGRVLHHRAHATEAAFGGEPFERLATARHEVIARRLGAWRAHLDDVAQGLTFGSRIAAKRLLGQPTERERRQLAALRSVRR